MSAISSVTVNGRTVTFHSFTGEVLESRKWSTTDVSSSGSYSGSAAIQSTNTTHDQVFLRSSEGKELAVEVEDLHLAVRPGHRVTMIWAIKEGTDRGPYIAACNHTTGDVNRIGPMEIEALVTSKLAQKYVLAIIIIGLLFLAINGWIALAVFGCAFWLGKLQFSRSKAIRTAVDGVLSKVKAA